LKSTDFKAIHLIFYLSVSEKMYSPPALYTALLSASPAYAQKRETWNFVHSTSSNTHSG